VTEAGLAAKLEKVSVRLAADAPGLERPGADLIAYYLSPGRHPAGRPWSRKHADTQRRLCERYLAPVIAGLACEDIKTCGVPKVCVACELQRCAGYQPQGIMMPCPSACCISSSSGSTLNRPIVTRLKSGQIGVDWPVT
jgi:hypothetical protein